MTSTNTYALVTLAEKLRNPADADTIRHAIAEIERLERRVERLSQQLEDLGEKPAPGD